MAPQVDTIGLIAGNNQFPFLFARAARAQGIRVVAAAIRGDTSRWLRFFVDRIAWFRVGELRNLFAYFQQAGVRYVIMAGQINPGNLFDEKLTLDADFQTLMAALRDRKTDTIFKAVADKLNEVGLELLDSTFLLKAFMAPRGTLTPRGPTATELADIEFGKAIAKDMGRLDVGQTVVIKEKAIVAIEAMEGTDRCIYRGGSIARKGAVVVKMSKPQQDQRFDVPVVGPRTIRTMQKCRACCLAVEAGKTLIIDQSQCVSMASRTDMTIVAVPS